jgi:Cys-rich repeat protein
VCAPFGGGCSCWTDRDCMDGELCRQTGFKGERNCVECGQDEDCPQGEVCIDNICEPAETTGATTSGTSTGTSSG